MRRHRCCKVALTFFVSMSVSYSWEVSDAIFLDQTKWLTFQIGRSGEVLQHDNNSDLNETYVTFLTSPAPAPAPLQMIDDQLGSIQKRHQYALKSPNPKDHTPNLLSATDQRKESVFERLSKSACTKMKDCRSGSTKNVTLIDDEELNWESNAANRSDTANGLHEKRVIELLNISANKDDFRRHYTNDARLGDTSKSSAPLDEAEFMRETHIIVEQNSTNSSVKRSSSPAIMETGASRPRRFFVLASILDFLLISIFCCCVPVIADCAKGQESIVAPAYIAFLQSFDSMQQYRSCYSGQKTIKEKGFKLKRFRHHKYSRKGLADLHSDEFSFLIPQASSETDTLNSLNRISLHL